MGRLGYYNDDLLVQHEAEASRRHKLQDEILEQWKRDAKKIQEENETMLQKEARREAVYRIEDSARSIQQYDYVTILWDCLDIIEGWRLAKAESLRTELLTDHEFVRCTNIFPTPIKHTWWRQLFGGNFIDIIYDCPHEIQELTSSLPVYELTALLDEKQKEILYYWVIRQWTPQRIAEMRGQTDRNIRKVYAKMIADIQRKMFERLYHRYKLYWNLTVTQTVFVEWYIGEHSVGKIRAKLPLEVENALRRAEHEPAIQENKRILGEIQCVCVQAGQRWQFIHHACGGSPAHCIRPDEGRNSCGGSPERGATCHETRRGQGATECHHAVCLEIWPYGVYVCFTYND